MRIDEVNDNILKTLNLGCFPKDILQFQDSQDFFQQLVFIDYQLQLLIQNEFDGSELVPARVYGSNETTIEKITQLINYAENINSNYNDVNKQYYEKLYCNVLLGHLYYLNSQNDIVFEILNSITVDNNFVSSKLSYNCNRFLNYLVCRYNVLIGLDFGAYGYGNGEGKEGYKLWIDYLYDKQKPFNKSEIAGNYWLEIMFKYLSLTISNHGERQINFQDVLSLKFKQNENSFIRYCNYLINMKLDINVNKIITKQFKIEYSKYLNDIIVHELHDTNNYFPNANEEDSQIDDFINNLYSTMKGKKMINPKSSKNYFIKLFKKTYQSKTVLANYIKVLVELNEFDEAFSAFKTYISYIEKDEEINKGEIFDIISIIEIYSICLMSFNPINSIKLSKFKYLKMNKILPQLITFTDKFKRYLNILKDDCNLNYDDDFPMEIEKTSDKLSFLYKKYNINILLNDRSDLIELISKSWYSLGLFEYFKLIYETPNNQIGSKNEKNLLLYYKNSLIVNSTGNLLYLFNYALVLAYLNDIKSSTKLCKFILKKYPESFETWNLLSLNTSIDNVKDSEKFINNGLNIAGIYIVKCKNDEFEIPIDIKYQILQLKLTQLSILELIYDTPYIMEFLSDVFILFYELFNVKFDEQINNGGTYLIDSKWSHRPSFIDPKNLKDSPTTKKQLAKDNIKKISKIHKNDNELKSINHHESLTDEGKKILQQIWLWTSKIYFKMELYEESELCIIEAENIHKPNIRTFIQLGYLTSKQSKFLSLQEFEKSLEKLDETSQFNKVDYLENLLGISKLFLVDDSLSNSLFISLKDYNSGIIRLKNLLENFTNVWPIGKNSIEIWYYLSIIYEKFDDKILFTKSLEKCIELENLRPVRNFSICDHNLIFLE
ncbi:hypothetical protein CLIB1444_01S18624 [[Candida] jaroonii]|uniref:Uncharacterized protein n=1 Tax=[Candida] jaroonii TaxID=467808 RepID=A0ACA9Y1Y3_9ASCO|nr:hypothetical protein CLIB1444_01S18624 [[Candida] jaroonii]